MANLRSIMTGTICLLLGCGVLSAIVPAGQGAPAQVDPEASPAASRQRRVQLGTIAGEKTVIRDSAGVRRIDAASKDAAIRSDEYIVARWADREEKIPPISSPDATAWFTGFGFIGVAPDGQEIRFRPVIETAGGLSLAKDGKVFQTRIFVGLRDNKNPDASYGLPQPISLLVGGEADELTPRQLTISHTNLPICGGQCSVSGSAGCDRP